MEGPMIHGSSNTRNGLGGGCEARVRGTGSKESRNEASPLRCFTVKAMLDDGELSRKWDPGGGVGSRRCTKQTL